MKGPREEPEMSQNFSSGVNRIWRLLTSHSFHPWYVPWKKPAQSTWGRRWWKAIPWKNRRCPDRTLEEPAMSTIVLQMWHLRFFSWTLHMFYFVGQKCSCPAFTVCWLVQEPYRLVHLNYRKPALFVVVFNFFYLLTLIYCT